jgi:1-acyl-sn-glycerol-3-phosphate acyltransferase
VPDVFDVDDDAEWLELRDPDVIARVIPFLRLVLKVYFRAEVEGVENVPAEGGVLMVSNHNGGLVPMDVPVVAVAFYDHFGPDRPLYILAHDLLFMGLGGKIFPRGGFVRTGRQSAATVLRSGAATIVFPGGDYDVFRPSADRNRIDFNGRMGYVRTALEADVPIVPVVHCGTHENQIHLSRGEWLARLFNLEKLLRTRYVPITFGFPFGLTAGFPPNLPLPTKIQTRFLDPIYVREEFGDNPAVPEVDRVIRERMQGALDDMARSRRFPVLG